VLFGEGSAVAYGDTTLPRQTVVFLKELLEAASQLAQCVIVLTLTSTQEAYGERTQQVLDALRQMQQIAKRMVTVEILTTEEARVVVTVSSAFLMGRISDC